MKLRAYQSDLLRNSLDAFKSVSKIIVQSPVGTGKTHIGVAIVKSLNVPTLWLAHTTELIQQAQKRLPNNVTVETIQSVYKRDKLKKFKLIVIDECHRTMAGSEDGMYRSVLKRLPDAKVLGLTATPMRADGKPLMAADGGVYDRIIVGKSVQWHCDRKHILKPLHYTSPEAISTKSININSGGRDDFSMKSAGQHMSSAKLCGNVVSHYKSLASGKQAVVFACNHLHANHLADRFKLVVGKTQVRIISGTDRPVVRSAIFSDFCAHKFKILINVNIVTEGWDYPELSVAIIARPTRSRTLYIQMAGRVMRPAPKKPQPIILDHGGIFHHHGLVTDDFDWVAGKADSPAYVRCRECGLVMERFTATCKSCGFNFSDLSDTERQSYERLSSYEENEQKLVLAEKLEARKSKPKRLKRRERDPNWEPMEQHTLSAEKQKEIYDLWLQGCGAGRYFKGLTNTQIGELYGLSHNQVYLIASMSQRLKAREAAKKYSKNNRIRVQAARRKRDGVIPPNKKRDTKGRWQPITKFKVPVELQKQLRKAYVNEPVPLVAIAKRFGLRVDNVKYICSMQWRKAKAWSK